MFRGKAYAKLGKVKEAMQDYNSAIRTNAQNGQAYLYRGILRANTKRIKAACADFHKALQLGVEEAQLGLDKYCK